MVIVVATIWISILLLLIFKLFTFANKNSPKYSKNRYLLLWAALLIHIVILLAFIMLILSFSDTATSI